MNENKTNINWLSLIYLTPYRNPYKIRKKIKNTSYTFLININKKVEKKVKTSKMMLFLCVFIKVMLQTNPI